MLAVLGAACLSAQEPRTAPDWRETARALADSDRAENALWSLPGGGTLTLWRDALGDADAQVVAIAVDALAALGPAAREAVPALLALRTTAAAALHRRIDAALRAIG